MLSADCAICVGQIYWTLWVNSVPLNSSMVHGARQPVGSIAGREPSCSGICEACTKASRVVRHL
jgi:hypothetical protein